MDLRYLRFGERDIKGDVTKPCDLSDIYLSQVDFRRADLKNVDLSNAFLRQTNSQDANLHGANLEKTIIIETNFKYADLHGVNLGGAKILKANFQETNLTGANFSFDTDSLEFYKNKIASMQEKDWNRSLYHNRSKDTAHITKTNFNDADLSEALLYGVDLSNASFYRPNLTGAKAGGLRITSNTNIPDKNLRGVASDTIFNTYTDLRASSITNKQLNTMNIYRGTILPDGNIYKGIYDRNASPLGKIIGHIRYEPPFHNP